MSDFKARLQEEFAQLEGRLEKLDAFLVSDRYDELPEIDRADLKEQAQHMRGYVDVLSRRVSRLCN